MLFLRLLKKTPEMQIMSSNDERVELEMKILRYRQLERQIATDPETIERIRSLIVELEQKLRAIDE